MAGPSEYWFLASSPASKVKKKNNAHTVQLIHITTHTRQLQQYTRSTNNNYTKDNLKLATKHTRQFRILQHVQKVKTPKQESTVYCNLRVFLSPEEAFCMWVFLNRIVLQGGVVSPKLEDHPLSAVHDCLFNLFAATLHIGGRSSIRNLRTRHAVVTETHYMEK